MSISIVGSPPSSGDEMPLVRFPAPAPGVGRWANTAPESKAVKENAPMKGRRYFATLRNMATPLAGGDNPSTAISYTCRGTFMQAGKNPVQKVSTESKRLAPNWLFLH